MLIFDKIVIFFGIQVFHEAVFEEGKTSEGEAREHQEQDYGDCDEHQQPFGVFEELDEDGGDEEGGDGHAEESPDRDDDDVALAFPCHVGIELSCFLVVVRDAEKEGRQDD